MPSQERKFVRIQENGQVTLPAEVRRKLGLKKGDVVAVEETGGGVLLTPQEPAGESTTNRIVDVLREQGLSFDAFLQASREERTQLLKQALGLPPAASDEAILERAKTNLFSVVDELRRRNQDKDPDEVYRDVTAIVEEVRQQRYEQQKA